MSERTVLLLFLGDPAQDRRVQNILRFYREHGIDASLIAGYKGASAPDIDLKNVAGPRRFFEFDRKLKRTLAPMRADVVIACDLYSLSAALRMTRRGQANFLIYDAREVYTELPTVAHRPLAKWYWKRKEQHGLMYVDRILVTAPHDLQAILDVHHFVPRSLLIRNLPWNDPLPKATELGQFGIASGNKVLVYVGGLQQGRGLPQLVHAMRDRQEQLLLIGDGIMRKELEANASPNVHFAGAVDADRTLGILAACDVGISLTEPVSKSYELALPSKIFEYMAAGLPVVSTRLMHVVEHFATEPWIAFVAELTDSAIGLAIDKALHASNDETLRSSERKLFEASHHFGVDAAPLLDMLQLPQVIRESARA